MLHKIESASAAHMVIDGRPVLNFGGSSYLGLARRPELLAAATHAIATTGATAQLPRHYGFALAENLNVEQAARDFFNTEDAVYFGSGYMFGAVSISALHEQHDVVIVDESAHYNLLDGARVAQKPIRTFKHCDAEDLARVVQEQTGQGKRPLVATDGMFATYGDSPPLSTYVEILEPHQGWLLVDESHGFGALGKTACGACEAEGVLGLPRVIAGGSTAKALCAYGGIALGSKAAIKAIWSSAAMRGSASGVSAGAAMTAASLGLVRADPAMIENMRCNARRLKALLSGLGFDYLHTDSPLATFALDSAQTMKDMQAYLWQRGIFAIYSNYVGSGTEGALRFAAFADHSVEDFERLETVLRDFMKK